MSGYWKAHKLKRMALHFPVGLASAGIAYASPTLAMVFGFGFLGYEIIEEWRIRDKGWHDIAGFLWGIAIGAIILIVLC